MNDKAEQCWGDNVNEIAVDAELDSIRAWARGPSFGGNLDDIFNCEALDSRDKLLVVLEERRAIGQAWGGLLPHRRPGFCKGLCNTVDVPQGLALRCVDVGADRKICGESGPNFRWRRRFLEL